MVKAMSCKPTYGGVAKSAVCEWGHIPHLSSYRSQRCSRFSSWIWEKGREYGNDMMRLRDREAWAQHSVIDVYKTSAVRQHPTTTKRLACLGYCVTPQLSFWLTESEVWRKRNYIPQNSAARHGISCREKIVGPTDRIKYLPRRLYVFECRDQNRGGQGGNRVQEQVIFSLGSLHSPRSWSSFVVCMLYTSTSCKLISL